jgi:hypothetical protein
MTVIFTMVDRFVFSRVACCVLSIPGDGDVMHRRASTENLKNKIRHSFFHSRAALLFHRPDRFIQRSHTAARQIR